MHGWQMTLLGRFSIFISGWGNGFACILRVDLQDTKRACAGIVEFISVSLESCGGVCYGLSFWVACYFERGNGDQEEGLSFSSF